MQISGLLLQMLTDALDTLSRKDLQAMAKQNGIKANQKNFQLVAELTALREKKECTLLRCLALS
jgi:hypothetical protein